jgi:flagellar hook-associated protein 3 FlgL
MAVTGIGSTIAASTLAQQNLQTQLDTLSRQLGTGQKAAVYSDLGAQAGLTVGLDSQLSAINAYDNTNTTVSTTLSIEQEALTQLTSVENTVQQAANLPGAFSLNGNGQTTVQANAATQLDQILALLNTRSGDNYLFSGGALNQTSVETTDHILNGNGALAGLKQVISERNQADLGASGLGRLVIPPVAGSTVSINEDVAGSPFGFKLAGVSSTLTGATFTQPAGSPKTETVTLGSNPNEGESVQFSLTLPDGTSQSISLQATAASPPGANQFTIGPTAAATAANLQAALTAAVSNLTATVLPAASAVAAANNFFNSIPPQRVAGPPFNTATALQNGTAANTVFWYTGESGATPARQTVTALVGPSLTISYGIRASEPALGALVANVAALAATNFASTNPNAQAIYSSLAARVSANLAPQSGAQNITDIEADIANAQTTANNAKTVNQQTKNTLTGLLQSIENVSPDKIGAQILTLQNSLQAGVAVDDRTAFPAEPGQLFALE